MLVKVCIHKPILRDYLNYLFTFQNGHFVVKRETEFGRSLSARIQYSKEPPAKSDAPDQVEFLMPKSRRFRNAGKKYLFVPKDDQESLNDFLEAVFAIDFDRYYLQGRKLEYKQKDIIQAFIVSRRLQAMIGDNETLKKRQYRDALKYLEKRVCALTRKAYYRNEQIERSLRGDIELIAS